MKIVKLIAASMLASALLTACGGGGGSSPAPPAAKTIVNGVATKGPFLKDSTVNVYAVVNGAKGALLASTLTTDDNGNYSADLGSYTGPVIVEVSGTFHDEATGRDISVAGTAPIRAALPNAQGTVTLPVTPLTELAVQKAASLAPAAITAANALVSDLFKVDIIATMPVAPTAAALADATQAQKDYTLALAAVSQMASDGAGANDADKLKNALDKLSQGISATGMDATASTAFQGALGNFVGNANNKTGISDTTSTSLVNAGTTSKSYTLSVGNVGTGAFGVQFHLALPEGVTLNLNGEDAALLASSFAMLVGGTGDSLVASKYAAGGVTVAIVSSKAMTAGGIAKLTCNLASGGSAPAASAFVLDQVEILDAKGAALSGATLTLN